MIPTNCAQCGGLLPDEPITDQDVTFCSPVCDLAYAYRVPPHAAGEEDDDEGYDLAKSKGPWGCNGCDRHVSESEIRAGRETCKCGGNLMEILPPAASQAAPDTTTSRFVTVISDGQATSEMPENIEAMIADVRDSIAHGDKSLRANTIVWLADRVAELERELETARQRYQDLDDHIKACLV